MYACIGQAFPRLGLWGQDASITITGRGLKDILISSLCAKNENHLIKGDTNLRDPKLSKSSPLHKVSWWS